LIIFWDEFASWRFKFYFATKFETTSAHPQTTLSISLATTNSSRGNPPLMYIFNFLSYSLV
jgi:hypothetical protein